MSTAGVALQGDEESLSTGVDRRLQAARELQEHMGNYVSDLERLKSQCDKSKLELTRLRDEKATIETELTRLKADRAHEEAQLQAVQIEYAAALEDNAYLAAGEASTSAELAELGRVRRRLCFQEEKAARLEEQLRQAEDAHNAAVEAEQAVAAGLRERIGRLERRLREKEGESSESMARVRSASAESEHELAVMRAEVERLTRESADARDALAVEVKGRMAEARRAEKLAEELQDAREEGRLFKEVVAERDRLRLDLNSAKSELELFTEVKAERDRLKPELARAQAKAGDTTDAEETSTRPLRTVSPNTPLTPSKGESAQSPKSPSARELAHIKRELAHTKSQHASLKAAHDELNDKYTKLSHKRDKEKQHFKEFHTVYMAKKEAKRKRREMQASSSVAGSGAPTPPGPSSQPSAMNSSGPVAPAEAEVEVAQDDVPEPPAKRVRQSPPPVGVPERHSPPRVLVPERVAVTPQAGLSKSVPERGAAPVSEPLRRLPSARTVSAPTTTPGARTPSGTGAALTRQASRVTPWLGGSTSRPSLSSRKRPVQRDSFGSDSDDDALASPAPARTPLVRDRTGTASMASDGLRLQALKRAALDDTASPKKLDFEGLSAEERAAERRKLSRLSTAERREVYAPYKGKGRYVAPEDVKKTFADEYEIDPAKNDGVRHQYDSVVRNRDERRKMHGGDCECCRQYYEAVGDIPRFHSGPAWRDPTSPTSPSKPHPSTSGAVDIEDHQNRVSRHREVWRRPPTPPDYWKIGFPTTQDVEKVNRKADEMVARREAEVRREAAKWRKKV